MRAHLAGLFVSHRNQGLLVVYSPASTSLLEIMSLSNKITLFFLKVSETSLNRTWVTTNWLAEPKQNLPLVEVGLSFHL